MDQGHHCADGEAPLEAKHYVKENADQCINDGEYSLLGQFFPYLRADELNAAHDDFTFNSLLKGAEHHGRQLRSALFCAPGRNANYDVRCGAKLLHDCIIDVCALQIGLDLGNLYR